MDFTKVNCMSNTCAGKNIEMDGAGGSFGGRITIAKLRCPVCGVVIMIVPMNKDYEYSVSATTEKERMQTEIDKAKAANELELARKITAIKERY